MAGVYSRLVFLAVMLIGTTAMPAPGGGANTGEIPWALITAQSFNFVVFLCLVTVLIKKFAVPHFPKFKQKFIEDSTKAQREMAEIEKQRKEIEDRLSKLETTYALRLDKAKKESQALKASLIEDAKNRSEKMIADASQAAQAAFKSSERQFKLTVLDQAIAKAKNELPKEIDDTQLQRLHGEFLEEIRVNA